MPILEICEARTKNPVAREESTGAFLVRDQRRYDVRSDAPLVAAEPFLLVNPHDARLATLGFDNYVGLAEISGFRFRVHSKLTEETFANMLDQVVRDVADLAFDYGSPTARPFDRDDLGASEEVLYHALAYLRHVMRRAEDRLLGQFLQIARHPHRRMEHEAQWMPVAHAAAVGPGGLLAVASHPERLVLLPHGSKLAETGLGRLLGKRPSMFPAEVLVSEHAESFDTHENRLVLHVLHWASDIIAVFEGRRFRNPDLAADLGAMREEIDWMLTFDFLSGVGTMRVVPSQSSVLQRREGYRDFLGHFIRLSQSSILAEDRHRWHSLLDLKDSALLYELWCFFEVKRALDDLLGQPDSAELVHTQTTARNIRRDAGLFYRSGQVELLYNATHRARKESYSVMLRPDVMVRVKRPSEWEALIFDAKLKFDGTKLSAENSTDPDEWERIANDEWNRAAKKEDLYKMHTYRDAICEAVGAFVLYPGSVSAYYTEDRDGPRWSGIGAIPLEPGKPTTELRTLLAEFLQLSAMVS